MGRAIAERLVRDGNGVVVLERDGSALGWLDTHAARAQLAGVVGSASSMVAAGEAADRAEVFGPLRGWVNNAAVFRDAGLDSHQPSEVLEIINLNLACVVVGCATAVRRFRAAGTAARSSTSPATRLNERYVVRCLTPRPKPRSRG